MLFLAAFYAIGAVVEQLRLAVAPGLDPGSSNALGNDIVGGRLGPALGELQVVAGAAAAIGVRGQFHGSGRVVFHEAHQLVQVRISVRADVRAVQVIEDVVEPNGFAAFGSTSPLILSLAVMTSDFSGQPLLAAVPATSGQLSCASPMPSPSRSA